MGEWIHVRTIFVLKEYDTTTPMGEWIHVITIFILKEYVTTTLINPLLSN